MKLRDWLPQEFFGGLFDDSRANKFLDVEVAEEYHMYHLDGKMNWRSWPGRRKHVMNWCVLANGYAVGWNENPSVGWSFPVIKMKGE